MTLCNDIINQNQWTKINKRNKKKNNNIKIKYYDNYGEKESKRNLIVNINNREYVYPPKAGTIIFTTDFSKVLLVLNNYNPYNMKWGLPKGHLDKTDDSFEECASRELMEETGIKINISKDDKFIKINNTKYFIYVLDKDIINNLRPLDTNEIFRCEFKPIEYVPTLNLNKESITVLTKKIKYCTNNAKVIYI